MDCNNRYTHHISVQDFEKALKATNKNFVIDERPKGNVSRILGTVPFGNSLKKVVWHISGECFSPKGSRLKQFDINLQF